MNPPPPIRFRDGEELTASKLNRLIDLASGRLIVKPFPDPNQWIHPFKILPKPLAETEGEMRPNDWRTVRVHAGNVNGSAAEFCDVDIVIPANVTDYELFLVALVSDQCGDGGSGRGTPPCHTWPGTNRMNTQAPQITRLFVAHGANADITMDGYNGPYGEDETPYNFNFGLIEPGGAFQEVDVTYPDPVPTFDVFTQYDERYTIPAGTAILCPGATDCVSHFYGVGNGFARCRIGKVTTKDGALIITEQRVHDHLTLALCGMSRLTRRPSWASEFFITRTVLLKRPEFFSPDNLNTVLRSGVDFDNGCGVCLDDDFTHNPEWCAQPLTCEAQSRDFANTGSAWFTRLTVTGAAPDCVAVWCSIRKDDADVYQEQLDLYNFCLSQNPQSAENCDWNNPNGVPYPSPGIGDLLQPKYQWQKNLTRFDIYIARCNHEPEDTDQWIEPPFELCGT